MGSFFDAGYAADSAGSRPDLCDCRAVTLYQFSILNICDLSTDGCFTLGCAVGAVVTMAGHPLLAIPAAMLAGVLSGAVTALLQTKLGVPSILRASL